MREMDRLATALFPEGGPKTVDLKFFPGESQVTVDEFCSEIHAAFLQVDSGLVTRADFFDEDLKTVSVDRFLSNSY